MDSKTAAPVEWLPYAMNLPTSVVITGCDSLTILARSGVTGSAELQKPLNASQVRALLAKTAEPVPPPRIVFIKRG